MTINETYRELNRSNHIEHMIRQLSAKRDALISCLEPSGIRYDLDKVQTSASDRMPDTVADIAELDQKIEQLAIEKSNAIHKASAWIDTLQSDIERTVLYERFIRNASIRSIAETLSYTESNIYKLQRRGVRNLSKNSN